MVAEAVPPLVDIRQIFTHRFSPPSATSTEHRLNYSVPIILDHRGDPIIGQENPTPEVVQAVNALEEGWTPKKLANSNNPENLRLRHDPLAFFAASNKAWFKFVITNDSDLDEILALQSAHSLDPKRILLMPEARDRQSLAANRPRVADLCASRGFRFSDRLHLELWDARRGR